jgi:hypothetical protein
MMALIERLAEPNPSTVCVDRKSERGIEARELDVLNLVRDPGFKKDVTGGSNGSFTGRSPQG